MNMPGFFIGMIVLTAFSVRVLVLAFFSVMVVLSLFMPGLAVFVRMRVIRLIVVMVIVVAGIAVRMVMGAQSDGAIAIQKIEASQEEHSNARKQRIETEAGVEEFLDSSVDIVIEEKDSPCEQSQDRKNLEEFLHGS
jgi:hypothetical protein